MNSEFYPGTTITILKIMNNENHLNTFAIYIRMSKCIHGILRSYQGKTTTKISISIGQIMKTCKRFFSITSSAKSLIKVMYKSNFIDLSR